MLSCKALRIRFPSEKNATCTVVLQTSPNQGSNTNALSTNITKHGQLITKNVNAV